MIQINVETLASLRGRTSESFGRGKDGKDKEIAQTQKNLVELRLALNATPQ